MTWSKSIEQQSPDLCVDCGDDTSFSSGKFINRIPFNDAYLCPDCLDETEKEFEVERDKEIAQFKLEKGLKK
jgi:hypothetical protein